MLIVVEILCGKLIARRLRRAKLNASVKICEICGKAF